MRLILLTAFLSASAFAADPIRAFIRDDQQPTQKTAYGEDFGGANQAGPRHIAKA